MYRAVIYGCQPKDVSNPSPLRASQYTILYVHIYDFHFLSYLLSCLHPVSPCPSPTPVLTFGVAHHFCVGADGHGLQREADEGGVQEVPAVRDGARRRGRCGCRQGQGYRIRRLVGWVEYQIFLLCRKIFSLCVVGVCWNHQQLVGTAMRSTCSSPGRWRFGEGRQVVTSRLRRRTCLLGCGVVSHLTQETKCPVGRLVTACLFDGEFNVQSR